MLEALSFLHVVTVELPQWGQAFTMANGTKLTGACRARRRTGEGNASGSTQC